MLTYFENYSAKLLSQQYRKHKPATLEVRGCKTISQHTFYAQSELTKRTNILLKSDLEIPDHLLKTYYPDCLLKCDPQYVRNNTFLRK